MNSIASQTRVKFLTYNVWQEGTKVVNGLKKIEKTIVLVNPDVICFTEVRNYKNEDWTTKIQKALEKNGLYYYRGYAGGDVSVLSKYPISSPKLTGNGSVSTFKIEVKGKQILVAAAHLDYTQYACYLPRGYYGGIPSWKAIVNSDGELQKETSVEKILAYNLSSKRDEQLTSFLESIKSETIPVVLLGDFNEPSHLDWAESTRNLFDHNGLIVPWNNSILLAKNGFKDAYRVRYPDPLKNPGFTWPSKAFKIKSTSWTPRSDERDRIDYVYYKGTDIRTLKAAIVGPKASFVNNKLSTSYTKDELFIGQDLEWPSDHKAVLIELEFYIFHN